MTSPQKSPLRFLLTYLGPQKWMASLLVVLVLATISLQLINPQIMRAFLDGVQNNRPLDDLLTLALLFIGVAILRQLFRLAGSYVGEIVAWTATNALRGDLALHCLKLDMGFHKVHKPGELIERVDGDVNQLAAFFSQLIVQLGANLLLCTGILALLWTIDWTIGAMVTAVTLCGLYVIRLLNSRAVPRVQALREIEATLFGYLEEWLHGTETIRSNAAEPYILNRLYGLLRERWQRGHASMKLTVILNGVPNVVFSLAYITLFTLGAWRFSGGRLSIGTLYITFYYIDLLRDPLWQLARQLEEIQRMLASVNRINELFGVQPTILDTPRYTTLPATGQGVMVEFDQLTFAYSDEPESPVLDRVHFTLQPGKVLGLLGRTGSGKTSLTKLLLRFYDPTEGAIRLGDGTTQVDLREIAQQDLRQQIGVVTQQVQLFNATVRDNLTLFDPAVEDEKVVAALNEVGLGAWLSGLPEGLDSHLAADGGLSAGEAQLLAFSRIFLANPQLIILDEASSRLDPATEQQIENALDKVLANRTVIIVAHRLTTVHRADEIMILSQGQVVEYGPQEVLAADANSLFYGLLQTGLAEAIS